MAAARYYIYIPSIVNLHLSTVLLLCIGLVWIHEKSETGRYNMHLNFFKPYLDLKFGRYLTVCIFLCNFSSLYVYEGEGRGKRERAREQASACVTPIKELTLAESSATQFHLFDKASFGVI